MASWRVSLLHVHEFGFQTSKIVNHLLGLIGVDWFQL